MKKSRKSQPARRAKRRAVNPYVCNELAYRHLEDFVRLMWPVVEPGTKYLESDHIPIICRYLERVTAGEIDDLVVCIPPGCMKSYLVSVFWPAWEWLRQPENRYLCTSNDDGLVKRDSRRTRFVVKSERYRALLKYAHDRHGRHYWDLAKDQQEKVNFENGRRGFRQCMPIMGAVTGKRGNRLIIDDPTDAKKVILGDPSKVSQRMQEINDIIGGVLSTRLVPGGARVLIMQRLHQEDAAAYLIAEGATHLVLPMEYDPDHKQLSADDFRTEPGQLLFPALYSELHVARLKRALGSRQTAGQLEQRPTPGEGGLFKRDWYQFYNGAPADLNVNEQMISVDATFDDGKRADFVTMQVWGRRGAKRYLLDQVRARMNYPATRSALVALAAKWPDAHVKLIEKKANGAALIADLRGQVPGLIGYSPRASKYARAQVAAVSFEAGNVWLPLPEHAPWIGDYMEELAAFGAGGANDDQVDATSQTMIRWARGSFAVA